MTIEKSRRMPIGTVSTWADGRTFRKEAEGRWVQVGSAPDSGGASEPELPKKYDLEGARVQIDQERLEAFEPGMTTHQLLELLGVPVDHVTETTWVHAGKPIGDKIDGVQITVQTDKSLVEATLRKLPNGKKVMDGHMIEMYDRGKGGGTAILTGMVGALRRAGYVRISATAEGDASTVNDVPPMNGYITWPKMGFDGPLPAAIRKKLPEEYADATRVSDLMRSPERRQWWAENGSSIKVSFDLDPGSRSSQVLEAYLRAKAGR